MYSSRMLTHRARLLITASGYSRPSIKLTELRRCVYNLHGHFLYQDGLNLKTAWTVHYIRKYVAWVMRYCILLSFSNNMVYKTYVTALNKDNIFLTKSRQCSDRHDSGIYLYTLISNHARRIKIAKNHCLKNSPFWTPCSVNLSLCVNLDSSALTPFSRYIKCNTSSHSKSPTQNVLWITGQDIHVLLYISGKKK